MKTGKCYLPLLLLLGAAFAAGCSRSTEPEKSSERAKSETNKAGDAGGDQALQEKSRRQVAAVAIQQLTQATQAYKVKHGEYPQSLDELAAHQPDGGQPFVTPDALIDPWGRKYQYDPAGPKNGALVKPDIWSEGPPAKLDGVIGNWPGGSSPSTEK